MRRGSHGKKVLDRTYKGRLRKRRKKAMFFRKQAGGEAEIVLTARSSTHQWQK